MTFKLYLKDRKSAILVDAVKIVFAGDNLVLEGEDKTAIAAYAKGEWTRVELK